MPGALRRAGAPMQVKNGLAFGLSAALLSGCASPPPIAVTYYLPVAETKLTATQTLGCTPDNTKLVSATSIQAETTYSADPRTKQSIQLSRVTGTFSSPDITLNFTNDGRLTGVNSDECWSRSCSHQIRHSAADRCRVTVRVFLPADDAGTGSGRGNQKGRRHNRIGLPRHLGKGLPKLVLGLTPDPTGGHAGKDSTDHAQDQSERSTQNVDAQRSPSIKYKIGSCPEHATNTVNLTAERFAFLS